MLDVVDLAAQLYEESRDVRIAILFDRYEDINKAKSTALNMGYQTINRLNCCVLISNGEDYAVVGFTHGFTGGWSAVKEIWYPDNIPTNRLENFISHLTRNSNHIVKRISFSCLKDKYSSVLQSYSVEADDDLNAFISGLSGGGR